MRILVACEESQVVTIEFRKLGHKAYSCDILPCSGGHPEWHIWDNVIPLLKDDWDMMIAFPPCTYLCAAGLHYSKKDPERMLKTLQAVEFFKTLYNSNIEKICIENPVGYISTVFRKPDQIINPFNFGVAERKKTCLWLKGLPLLKHTKTIEVKPYKSIIRKTGKKAGETYNYYWRQGKSAFERSKTFPCIAKVMAEQWGKF